MTTMVFGIIGGLGIFLLGMKNMSEGMQAVAGDKLRKLIAAITNNRLLACGVGTVVTMLIQSSSITTVMVVGMVNAGIMNLMQAIGVILGANIGTTITGWILVLKIGKFGLPLLGISALFYLFSKNERIRYTASIFLGLGMVFYGLTLMKTGFAPIKGMPAFEVWFSHFTPYTYFGVLKVCLVGALLTAIVQSSSATLGITIGLAYTGIIDYPTAAALVLGENIGTTITAFLASLGASANAKRASYAHMLINVIGVFWITAIFFYYIKFISTFIGVDPTLAVETAGEITYPNSAKAIAATHTIFNVINVIIFLPFMSLLNKLLYRIVPEKESPQSSKLTFLDVRMLDTPVISLSQSQAEIARMAIDVEEMMNLLKDVIGNSKKSKKKQDRIFELERNLDIVQKEITDFIGHLMTGNIPHSATEQAHSQLRLADEYESVSDYIVTILKLTLKMLDTNEKLSEQGQTEILDLHRAVNEYIDSINTALNTENINILETAETQGNAITVLMKKYRSSHLNRLSLGTCTPIKSLIFTDILNSYRRIKDHILNIAEVVAGEK